MSEYIPWGSSEHHICHLIPINVSDYVCEILINS